MTGSFKSQYNDNKKLSTGHAIAVDNLGGGGGGGGLIDQGGRGSSPPTGRGFGGASNGVWGKAPAALTFPYLLLAKTQMQEYSAMQNECTATIHQCMPIQCYK